MRITLILAVALAGLARVSAVAEHRIVTRRAVGLELADAASDVVAVVAVGALVAVEAGRSRGPAKDSYTRAKCDRRCLGFASL